MLHENIMILFLVFLFIIVYLKNRKITSNSLKVYISHLINQCYMEFEDLVFIIVAILIAVVLLKIFMWLLPVIVVLLIAFFIYMYLKERSY